MQCNIDSRGKSVRLGFGAVLEGVGLILCVLWFLGMAPDWAGIVGALLVVSGWVMIFEGAAGWCMVRAMGFKTPL